MKRILKQSLVLASLALLSATASAQITNTPHNLTTSAGANGVNTQSSTQQICVFCHTPHASNTANVNAPLWNKAFPGTTYTTYSTSNSPTIDGTVLAPTGSVSAACLSCHDGTQAMDNMMNQPGSGGYNSLGASAGYSWSKGAAKITGVANLDGDLRNDHPIGIQYCGGGLTGSGATVTGSCKDKDFVGPGGSGTNNANFKADSINGAQVFWVDVTGGTSSRDKTDVILYTRDFGGTSGPSVECASCHDPHMAKTTNSSDVHFMRISTNGSTICLACHVK